MRILAHELGSLPRFENAFKMDEVIFLFEHSFYYRLRKVDGVHWYRDLGPMDTAWPWFRCAKPRQPMIKDETEADRSYLDLLMEMF